MPNDENFLSWNVGSSVACLKSEIASDRCASLRPGRSRTEISAALGLGTIAARRAFGVHPGTPGSQITDST